MISSAKWTDRNSTCCDSLPDAMAAIWEVFPAELWLDIFGTLYKERHTLRSPLPTSLLSSRAVSTLEQSSNHDISQLVLPAEGSTSVDAISRQACQARTPHLHFKRRGLQALPYVNRHFRSLVEMDRQAWAYATQAPPDLISDRGLCPCQSP